MLTCIKHKKTKQNKSEQVERYINVLITCKCNYIFKIVVNLTRSICTTDYRFESCYSLDDKRSVMERLDNPVSEVELKEQELLKNVQSKWKYQSMTTMIHMSEHFKQ